MIRVNETLIDVSVINVINKLKLELLKRDKDVFRDIKYSGQNIMVTCPFHAGGEEQHPSASILTEDKDTVRAGHFNCFTCKKSLSLSRLVSELFDEESHFSAFGDKWLLDNFGLEAMVLRDLLELPTRRPAKEEVTIISEEELDTYRYTHPYMYKRGLTDSIIDRFDIGYDINKDVITFPVKDEFGRVVFVATRSVEGKVFRYPQSVKKPVYGLYDCLKDKAKSIVVCESAFNALSSWKWGYPAIALFGTGNINQTDILKKSGVKEFVLALDPDDAGKAGTARFIKAMRTDAFIKVMTIPDGKDVNDLTKEEFLFSYSTAKLATIL